MNDNREEEKKGEESVWVGPTDTVEDTFTKNLCLFWCMWPSWDFFKCPCTHIHRWYIYSDTPGYTCNKWILSYQLESLYGFCILVPYILEFAHLSRKNYANSLSMKNKLLYIYFLNSWFTFFVIIFFIGLWKPASYLNKKGSS